MSRRNRIVLRKTNTRDIDRTRFRSGLASPEIYFRVHRAITRPIFAPRRIEVETLVTELALLAMTIAVEGIMANELAVVRLGETGAHNGCNHDATIHVFDEHRGASHRCKCGVVVRAGMFVGHCEICDGLLTDPEIVGVQPLSRWQVQSRMSVARDTRQLELDFGDLSASARCSACSDSR